jgi:acyl-CoA thioesterase I
MAARAMRHRGVALIAAVAVLIAAVVAVVAVVRLGGASAAARADHGGPASEPPVAARMIDRRDGEPGPAGRGTVQPGAGSHGRATSCRVSPANPAHGGTRPLLVVLGASFTAGVGAPGPAASWAVRLATILGWRAVTLGVPGMGYTRPGAGHLGPVSRILARVHLAQLHPALVIIQAGHDDWRVPAAAQAAHVADLIRRLRHEAPAARLAFLTVFAPYAASPATLAAEAATDAIIVSAIRKTDPRAVVIDPLRSRWQFPRAADGLHPTAAGNLLIAQRVARSLARAGAATAAAPQPSPAKVTCTVVAGSQAQPSPGQPAAARSPRTG